MVGRGKEASVDEGSRRWRLGAVAVAVTAVCLATAGSASAIFLDADRNIAFRLRAYSQATLATEDSLPETDPVRKAGQLVQHRNFATPEFEAKLSAALGIDWLDDLSVRGSGWGFYDGVYDYGPEGYGDRAADLKFGRVVPRLGAGPIQPHTKGQGVAVALRGEAQRRDVRDIYGHRLRVNDAYVNIAKGPVFFRIGRQAISWGESDTIGLLDANNPFETVLGLPGLFQDLDEARVPLWTIRSTVQLFNTMGPFSSGFIDAYWVPGWLDTTISPLQVGGGSPYSFPPPALGGAPRQQVYQNLPGNSTANSRWGVRLQSVIAREFTTSAWFYTTFPIAPVPRLLGLVNAPGSVYNGTLAVSLENKLLNVIGLSTAFFSSPLNAVIRSEVELFNGETAFRVDKGITSSILSGFQQQGHIDRVNILRGEVGMDRNIFIRPLNPTNSFIWVTALVFESNLDDWGGHRDYRANGLLKPSAIRRELNGGATAGSNFAGCDGVTRGPNGEKLGCDFINKSKFEFFVQTHLETEMMHGRLKPNVTLIANSRGAATIVPAVQYRFSDMLIGDLTYINTHTFGEEANNGFAPGTGLGRDRDQLAIRLTYQLN